MAKKRLWSREEFIVVLNLYYKLPFGKLNHTTKEVKELAALIGRTDNSAQVRKSVDGPSGMLTEDHHHTVHEERQVCYSSHLRPKSLHL